jgi:hypothetical protein
LDLLVMVIQLLPGYASAKRAQLDGASVAAIASDTPAALTETEAGLSPALQTLVDPAFWVKLKV